ncbi:MAG TPA: hypothetical protein VLZ82_02810, partial [Microbacterium sp.]|nr:hypothetical protein [Microbacterium sp.]
PLHAAVAGLWGRPAAPASVSSEADGSKPWSSDAEEPASDATDAPDSSEEGEETEDLDATRVLPLATEAVSLVGSAEPTTFTELITGIPASASPDDAEPTTPATEAIAVFAPLVSNDDDDDSAVDDAEDDPHLAAMRTSLSSAASRFFDGPAPAYPFSPVRAGRESDAGGEPDASGDADAADSAGTTDAASEDDGRRDEDGHDSRPGNHDGDHHQDDHHPGDHHQG